MPTITVPFAAVGNADYMSWINGGSKTLSSSTTDTKDCSSGLFLGNLANIPDSAVINSVKFKVYLKVDRTNTSLYGGRLNAYFYNVDNAKISGSTYAADTKELITTGEYRAEGQTLISNLSGNWTAEQLKTGIRCAMSRYIWTTFLKVNFTISGIYLIVDYTLPKYTITTDVTPSGSGSVSGGGTFEPNSVITLTATPNNGYKFKQWTDGVTTATRTVTVTGDATYTAEFEATTTEPQIISVELDPQTVEANGYFFIKVKFET